MMKRRGFTIWQALLLLVSMGIIAAILFPILFRTRESDHPTPSGSCQSQLKQIALGFKQYIQDYDENYPRARSGTAFAKNNTWPDELMSYIKSRQIFSCPSDTNATAEKFISYGYNSNLSSKNESKMNNSNSIILNYEVTGSALATCGHSMAAVTASTRHLEGSNYSFADGHVKWFKPESVSDTATDGSTPSFVIH
jgi:prepilin-type processing-associated H-X9-DG protein